MKEQSPQISADERRYKYAELTEEIIGVFYEVYNELGSGFLEKVYEEAMSIVLRSKNIEFQRQVPVPVWFRGVKIGSYEADLVVAGHVLIELKACKSLDPRTNLSSLTTYGQLTSKSVFF